MSARPTMTPCDQGRQAQRHVDANANPYPVGSPERAEWMAGWYRGRADNTKHNLTKSQLISMSDYYRSEAKNLRGMINNG